MDTKAEDSTDLRPPSEAANNDEAAATAATAKLTIEEEPQTRSDQLKMISGQVNWVDMIIEDMKDQVCLCAANILLFNLFAKF